MDNNKAIEIVDQLIKHFTPIYDSYLRLDEIMERKRELQFSNYGMVRIRTSYILILYVFLSLFLNAFVIGIVNHTISVQIRTMPDVITQTHSVNVLALLISFIIPIVFFILITGVIYLFYRIYIGCRRYLDGVLLYKISLRDREKLKTRFSRFEMRYYNIEGIASFAQCNPFVLKLVKDKLCLNDSYTLEQAINKVGEDGCFRDYIWQPLHITVANTIKKLNKFKIPLPRLKVFRKAEDESTYFSGITTERALKRQYNQLMKIYHPDKVGGSTEISQEIIEEYSNMKKLLKERAAQ